MKHEGTAIPPRNEADRLTLSGIKLRPRIGVSPGERRQPQICEADITVWGDFGPSAASDSLDRAMDYTKILDSVLETAHSKEYNLLEALAHEIATTVLQRFSPNRVGVRLRKQPASMLEKLDHIEVEMGKS